MVWYYNECQHKERQTAKESENRLHGTRESFITQQRPSWRTPDCECAVHVDEPREKMRGPWADSYMYKAFIAQRLSTQSTGPAQSRVGGWWLSASAARKPGDQLSAVGRQDARWAAAGGCIPVPWSRPSRASVSSSVVARDSDPGTRTATLGSDSRSKNGMLHRGGRGASSRFKDQRRKQTTAKRRQDRGSTGTSPCRARRSAALRFAQAACLTRRDGELRSGRRSQSPAAGGSHPRQPGDRILTTPSCEETLWLVSPRERVSCCSPACRWITTPIESTGRHRLLPLHTSPGSSMADEPSLQHEPLSPFALVTTEYRVLSSEISLPSIAHDDDSAWWLGLH